MDFITKEFEDDIRKLIERYEAGETIEFTGDDADLTEHTIKCYQRGCGCLYCGKSAIPDRSPERDICTPADCARGLAEYLRRMED